MVKEEATPPLTETLPSDREAVIRRGWSLPDELTKLVLVRLPANELIGCKFVSKPWCSLISSPDFISDHIKRSKSDRSNHLLLFHYDPPYNPLERQPNPFRSIVFFLCPNVSVVGSANGLICIVGRSYHRKMTAADIWILNPVTGHIMKLPRPPKSPTDERVFDDECFGNAYFVFWWDSITGDADADGDGEYKLARIVPKKDYSNTTVASLWVSSSPETWSEIPVGFDGAFHHPSLFVSGCDIVVGGSAYWIVFDVVSRSRIKDMFVLSLDLKTLSLSLSGSPFPLHPNHHYSDSKSLYQTLVYSSSYVMFSANWEGKFALAERADGVKMYDVWTMDAVEGWTKKCSFDYPILKWISDVNGKTVIMITVEPLECGIALYDINTGEAEPIKDFIIGQLLASAHDFVGSLVSIKGFKPLETTDDLSPLHRVIWPYPPATSGMSGNYKMKTKGAGPIQAENNLFYLKYFSTRVDEDEEE